MNTQIKAGGMYHAIVFNETVVHLQRGINDFPYNYMRDGGGDRISGLGNIVRACKGAYTRKWLIESINRL